MNEKYERQMKKGVLDLLVLKLLEKEPKYGYQLITELRDKSGAVFLLKEGTLYPILYRLEEEGLVESRWSEPKDRQVPRKYYAMTEKGRQTLPEIADVWRQISRGIRQVMEEEEV
ncbi:MAG: helix-turn-helix transcriptional regulator [Roseburia sp.]|nr:helix-turn-helix transcriptional regulator [Roseburia sp.]